MRQVKNNNTLNKQLSEEHKYESKNISKCTLILPYAGKKGCALVRSLQRQQQSSLPDNMMSDIVSSSTKRSSCFNKKDEIPFEERHHCVYQSVCTTANCTEDYVVNVLDYRSM